jgi:dTDP-4-amino-4,6-dideoxygalactose transaminase
MIQLFTPHFRVEECLEGIRECLEKGWTGLGYKTNEIEEAWSKYTDLPFSHFLSSNTVGLHLALHIFKTKYGWADHDEIITTPLTFVSTNHAIDYCRLKPVFADIDDYLCLDPEDIKRKITPRTKAIMFVGIGGNTGQYEEVLKICRDNGLKMILDAAHMAGTKLKGRPVGHDADCTIFSFQAVKNLPTADSGMICFADKEDDLRARKLTWLGINKDTYARTVSQGTYKWMYDVEEVGFKYHGNSIMAAIALVSLKYLDEDNRYRRQLAQWYQEALREVDTVTVVPTFPSCESSRHLFQIKVPERDQLIVHLNEKNIGVGVHYRDNTRYKPYSAADGTCPQARQASDSLISLPMHMGVTQEDVQYVVEQIKEWTQKDAAM